MNVAWWPQSVTGLRLPLPVATVDMLVAAPFVNGGRRRGRACSPGFPRSSDGRTEGIFKADGQSPLPESRPIIAPDKTELSCGFIAEWTRSLSKGWLLLC